MKADKNVTPHNGGDKNQPPAERGLEPTQNGNGTRLMEEDQKQAITKMAAKYRIQAETLDGVLAALRSYDDAAKVIRELNKGDISRFLPSAAA